MDTVYTAYSYLDAPLEVHGIAHYDTYKRLSRLPDDLIDRMPEAYRHFGRRCPGVRVMFRTDSPTFRVKIELETLSPDIGMSIFACQSAYVFVGEYRTSRYLGHLFPWSYEEKDKKFEKTFDKGNRDLEDVVVWLPRNEITKNVVIEVEEGSTMLPPTPYTISKPIVFYGSSITEIGLASSLFNSYEAIICRHLDADFYNLGFSGSARGEQPMAEFIAGMDMSLFVLDYDHNAKDPEELRATHEAFYKTVRAAHPDLPILMLTRPVVYENEDAIVRRDIVRATYENALAAGDKHVAFLDGHTYFEGEEPFLCSVDLCHPNDYGFLRMAQKIEPAIRELLANA